MVKVKLGPGVRMAGPGGCFVEGDAVDLPPGAAQILINNGQGTLVEETETVRIEKAVAPAAEAATARPQRKRSMKEKGHVATED